MDIHLPPDLEKLVQRRLAAGHYGSANEVIRTALYLMEEQEAVLVSNDDEDLEAKLEKGWQSLRAGRSVDGEEFFAQLEAERKEFQRTHQK